MKLSLIVPSHHRFEEIKDLLKEIPLQNLDENAFEVLIVSNLEDPKLRSLCKDSSLVNVFYHQVGQVGVNRARNLGIEYSRGEILLFIDDDCRFPDPDYLGRVIEAHQKYPDTLGIGGRYIPPETLTHLEFAYFLNSDLWLSQSLFEDNKTRNLIGGCASYKKKAFARGLRFDPEIEFGGSETDFNIRLQKEGFELRLIDELDLIHKVDLTFRNFLKKAFKQGVGARRRDENGIHLGQFYNDRRVDSQQAHRSTPQQYRFWLVGFYLWVFDISFQIGYRYFDEKKRVPPLALIRSILGEFTYRFLKIFRTSVFSELRYSFNYWFRSKKH